MRQAHSEAAARSHRMPGKAPPLGPQPFAGLLVHGGLVLHPQRYLMCAAPAVLHPVRVRKQTVHQMLRYLCSCWAFLICSYISLPTVSVAALPPMRVNLEAP